MHKSFILASLQFLFMTQVFGTTFQPIEQLYAHVLGNEDACAEYTWLVQSALTKMGVQNSDKVLVKKMNSVGPTFARINLSSFTAFGIWIDEEYLDICTEPERIFHLYHEAAHYAQKHHQKIVIGSTVSLACVFFALKKLFDLNRNKSVAHIACIAGSGLLAGSALYTYALPMFVKKHEKQADLLAAKILMQTKQQDVLENHIENLRKIEKSEESTLWWDSLVEQITYLEEYKKQFVVHASL